MRVSIQFTFPGTTRSLLPVSRCGLAPGLVGRGRAAAVVAALVAVVAGVSPAVGAAGTCYPPPVEAPVAVAYREPACRYCAGHRGIDFDSRAGDSVRAVAEPAPGSESGSGGLSGSNLSRPVGSVASSLGLAVGLVGGSVVGSTLGWSGTPLAVGTAPVGAVVDAGGAEVVLPEPPQPVRAATTRRPTARRRNALRMTA